MVSMIYSIGNKYFIKIAQTEKNCAFPYVRHIRTCVLPKNTVKIYEKLYFFPIDFFRKNAYTNI